ncbi:hypothetical protein BE08_45885 [Sorangium cellulosum]|uniref:Uncharacterized protein n=1 Tax=Sorangium cellulosum TaxID=56 RepID=A0A150P679_SORCE|nr:hypothetical protein BE08_45885 [Sorangium cellulosum]
MGVTSVQRTDRTARRDARSAGAASGSRGSSPRRADLGQPGETVRRAAHRRDALPGAPRGERGFTTEISR